MMRSSDAAALPDSPDDGADQGRPAGGTGNEEAVRLNVPLSFHEEDPSFITDNGINRGAVSKELGIGGSPALAEDVMIARDCMLALHTGATVDIQHISSGNSVRMVKLAKELGAEVMAEVTPHHFPCGNSRLKTWDARQDESSPPHGERPGDDSQGAGRWHDRHHRHRPCASQR